MLQTLIKQNTFVVYNEFDKSYKIRNLLQEFFMLRAKFLNIDFQPLYKRAGEDVYKRQGILTVCATATISLPGRILLLRNNYLQRSFRKESYVLNPLFSITDIVTLHLASGQ